MTGHRSPAPTAVAWVNGRLVDPTAAAVSADDHALLTGDGVFETVKVTGRRPFALRRHVQRLCRSAARLDLCAEPERITAAVAAVLASPAAPAGLARLRITLTGGPSPLASTRGDAEPTLVVALAESPEPDPVVDVVTVPWTRNERAASAGAKTVSYADNVIALRYAQQRGASDAVFANTVGQLAETTGANVFLAQQGRLVTPTLASGCLAGVTRDLLLAWVEGVEERDVPLGALAGADEAFLTSSLRDVQPIRSVDGRPLAVAPGPLTAAAAARFGQRAAADWDP